MYYFTYGSNMNRKQMGKRCPGSKFLKKVYLGNYKFVYDGFSKNRDGAVANIIESKGDIIWGGLFEISDSNLTALDYYEGYPKAYNRKTVEVKDTTGNVFNAYVYYRIGKNIGIPNEEYRKLIIQGAQDCNLPEDYIKNVL